MATVKHNLQKIAKRALGAGQNAHQSYQDGEAPVPKDWCTGWKVSDLNQRATGKKTLSTEEHEENSMEDQPQYILQKGCRPVSFQYG